MSMSSKLFYTSVSRIADLGPQPLTVARLPRDDWYTGDYVVGELLETPDPRMRIELANGRQTTLVAGDSIVGAFGRRHATLEATGDWKDIGDDNVMQALTGAGLIGRVGSRSPLLPRLMTLEYKGHVLLDGAKTNMRDFVQDVPKRRLERPVIVIVGTSMSAGKTTAAKITVRQLKELGLSVVGAKLTGAGRYRDILAMQDAGADWVFDFVDVGLPSTVCPAAEYREALDQLISRIAATDADIVVAEAGASPLEPYNGGIALRSLATRIRCTILCASDPYAVVGVREAFDVRPDLVAGIATSTDAGCELVEKLVPGTRALNLLDKQSMPQFTALLRQRIGS